MRSAVGPALVGFFAFSAFADGSRAVASIEAWRNRPIVGSPVTNLVDGAAPRSLRFGGGGEGSEVFLCDFETGELCGLWDSAANPEICNGLDEDCDLEVDESATCGAGLSCCGTSGCVDVDTDIQNCGSCDWICPLPDNGEAGCTSGSCGVGSCNKGFDDCDGAPHNGCEVDLSADVDHCGGCDLPCPAAPNGVEGCAAGICVIATCNSGFDDCDASPENGCEADLNSDPSHCGDCQTSCQSGEVCIFGGCVDPE